MHESNESGVAVPAPPATAAMAAPSRDILTEILRDGARRLLVQAIDAEVDGWIERHADLKDELGRQQVVKNGHHPPRTLVTGIGPMSGTLECGLETWSRVRPRILGSSGNSGKVLSYFEEEVGFISEAVGGSFDDFEFVVNALEQAGVQRVTVLRCCVFS